MHSSAGHTGMPDCLSKMSMDTCAMQPRMCTDRCSQKSTEGCRTVDTIRGDSGLKTGAGMQHIHMIL